MRYERALAALRELDDVGLQLSRALEILGASVCSVVLGFEELGPDGATTVPA